MYDHVTRIRAILHYTEFGGTLRSIACKYGIGKSTLSLWVKHGSPAPRPTRTRKRRKSKVNVITDTISDTLAIQPLQTALQLTKVVKDTLAIDVSRTTVYKALHALKLSHKIATRSWKHQEVRKEHPFYASDPYTDDAISFDESGFYKNDRPTRGWGPVGERVPKGKPVPRDRLSLLLAIGKEGVIAKRILKGGVKGHHVASFMESLPDGRPLILDNCSVHKTIEVRNVCKEKRIELRYTPPYCPWHNPVENVFSQAKRSFQRLRLGTSRFESDIDESVAKVINFPGMFDSSQAKWRHDTGQQ